MPNWCMTKIIIHDKEENLKVLEDKLTEWTKEPPLYPNGFGAEWLGNICLGSGLVTKEEFDTNTEEYRCRGTLNDFETGGDELILETITAWGPMLKMWAGVLDKIGLEDATITYYSEEPGMGLYWSNDPEILKEPYIFDAYLDEKDKDLAECFDRPGELTFSEYDISQKVYDQILEKVKKRYPGTKSLEKIRLHSKESLFCVNKFKKVDLMEAIGSEHFSRF